MGNAEHAGDSYRGRPKPRNRKILSMCPTPCGVSDGFGIQFAKPAVPKASNVADCGVCLFAAGRGPRDRARFGHAATARDRHHRRPRGAASAGVVSPPRRPIFVRRGPTARVTQSEAAPRSEEHHVARSAARFSAVQQWCDQGFRTASGIDSMALGPVTQSRCKLRPSITNHSRQINNILLINFDIVKFVAYSCIHAFGQDFRRFSGHAAVHPVGGVIETPVNHLRADIRTAIPKEVPD
jgi:hypothetical protein